MLPSLSIVSISFNQADFLAQCLESVSGQKTHGVEYIVVDPGSSDGSREMLVEAHLSGCIDRLLLDPDQGPADGLNRGFAMASGEILGYINSDDRYSPDAFEFVRKFFAAHPEVDVLCGAVEMIDERGHTFLRARTSDRFDVRDYLAGICTIGQQATFFRRRAFERVGGFNAANRVAWDGEILVDMALAGCRFRSLARIFGEFRIRRGTISNSDGYSKKMHAYFERIREKLEGQGIRPYSDVAEKFLRLAYRFNPLRHAGYVLVRFL